MKQNTAPTSRSVPGTLALVSSLAAFFMAGPGFTQQVFLDDFESGNLSNWTQVFAPTNIVIATPTNKVPTGGLYSSRMTNSLCRVYASSLVPGGMGITAQSFQFTFWYYDNSGTAARAYSEVRAYAGGSYTNGGLAQLLAAGKYNTADMTGETYDGTKYQGRIVNGTPNKWFNLNATGVPSRSAGWHRFDIERGVTSANDKVLTFYVDGKIGRVFTNSNANAAWDSVVLGAGLGSTAGDAWFDGVQVIQGQAYITENPQSQTNVVGSYASLSVQAIGDAGTLSYQWRKDGTNITDATDSTLVFSSCDLTNAGLYSVVVSNILAVKTSTPALFQVVPAVHVTTQPTNQVVNLGSNATFYVEATPGNGSFLYYQWRFNGTNLLEATNAFYTVSNAAPANAGPYTVVVTNDVSDPPATSQVAVLTVNLPPSLTNATNRSVTVSNQFSLRLRATDDLSAESTPFQDFEAYATGVRVMFAPPTWAGGYLNGLDTNQVNATQLTNNFPAGHGGTRVVHVRWTWASNSPPASIRLTTTSAGVSAGGNPIISYTNRLRFDVYSDRELKIAVGARDTNPTGAIGATDTTTSGQIEWIGADGPSLVPTNVVPANTWTNLVFNPLTDRISSAYGFGNGVLNTTTGKGALEHLYLVSGDGLPNAYNLYLDNFVVMADKPISFTLNSGPAGAALDPVTGVLSWFPTNTGSYSFTVTATDFYGLTDTRSFTLTVLNPPPVIVLNSPTNGASFTAPASITLTATVTANGNPIDKVQFFHQATNLLAEVPNAPYTTNWTNVAAGSYSVSAKAVYLTASTASSGTANITVAPPPPPAFSPVGAPVGGLWTLSGTGVVGQSYVLLTASNLLVPITWMPVATNTADPLGAFSFPAQSVTNPEGFFRLRSE